MSFFSTEEEYATQTYDASSMMYGPKAGSRIRDDLAALAKDFDRVDLRKQAQSYQYDVGPTARFGVKEFDLLTHRDRLAATHNTLATVLMDPEHGIPIPDHPRFVWIDRAPEWSRGADKTQTVMPSVAINVKTAAGWGSLKIGGVPENDEGVNFVTTEVASLLGQTRWIAIWIPPAEIENDPLLRAAEFRFAVQGNSGAFHSPAFTIASARERWSLTSIARETEPAAAGQSER